MSYVIYTVVSALFLALYDLFKKVSVSEKNDIYGILFKYNFMAFLCCVVFLKDVISVNFVNLIYILIKSSLISLSWFFTMKAMSKLQLGLVVTFSLLGSVFTTIFAFFIFGEEIGYVQIGGILIVLLGLLFLSRLVKREESEINYKYLI